MDRVAEKAFSWIAKKGNTKTKLARILDISRPTLDKRLDGDSQWTWDEVRIISSLTDTTLDELARI